MDIYKHEVRDSIHDFIGYDDIEKTIIDSVPLQRLRYVHQLAMTYMLYPSATHRRFEHSLGVMELAGRIYDVLTSEKKIVEDPYIQSILITKEKAEEEHAYWRRALRIAALCHDIGHLPFSHAAEKYLLPDGKSHEDLTVNLIRSDFIKPILDSAVIDSEHVVKISVGKKKYDNQSDFTDWESLLSEIITSDEFGADRMDYLLRDSHHAGVAYGRFDHHRLIQTLKVLPQSTEDSIEPVLGVEEGGMHAAEGLLMARYFMFTQVYFHHVRRIYDIHLRDFLMEWLHEGKYPVEPSAFLEMTDNEVMKGIMKASRLRGSKGEDAARIITNRKHFKMIYTRDPADFQKSRYPGKLIYDAACKKYGDDKVRRDNYDKDGGTSEFPVLRQDGTRIRSTSLSDILKKLPPVTVDYVFIEPNLRENAEMWLKSSKNDIISHG